CTNARQIHAMDTLSEALVNLAQLNLTLGQYEQATDDIKTIIETAQQLSNESLAAAAYLVAGRALIYEEKPAAALRQLEEAERIVLQTKFYAAQPQLLALRSVALINLGRLDEAQPVLDQGRSF